MVLIWLSLLPYELAVLSALLSWYQPFECCILFLFYIFAAYYSEALLTYSGIIIDSVLIIQGFSSYFPQNIMITQSVRIIVL